MTLPSALHRALFGALFLCACTGRPDAPAPGARGDATLPLTTPRESSREAFLSSARLRVSGTASAVVTDVELPAHADGVTRVRDRASGVTLAVALDGAAATAGRERDGVVTYPAGGPAGSDVVQIPGGLGTEDFVVFETRPAREELTYRVDVVRAAGLRLVGGALELLDDAGTPRLRMNPPYVVDRHGARHDAVVGVDDCAVDRDPRAPWGRQVIPPGRATCTVRVAFGGAAGARAPLAYPVVVDPTWTSTTGAMTAARAGHTATLLEDGKVLIAGGVSTGGAHLLSAELFDPATNTFGATGSMKTGRADHVAVRLTDGDVLVAMGVSDAGPVGSGETYSPTSGTFTEASATAPRQGARAALLPDGQVLIAGGLGPGDAVLDSSLLWSPATGRFTVTGRLGSKRVGHLMLANARRVLAIGGSLATTLGDLSSVETYTDSTGTWSSLASLATGRRDLAGAVLGAAGSSRVFVAGGYSLTGKQAVKTAQTLDEGSGAWSAAFQLAQARALHTVTPLASGHALVAGGLTDPADPTTALASVELYDSAARAMVAAPPLAHARFLHAATPLDDGRVLITGGDGPSGPQATAELFALTATGKACDSPAQCLKGACVDGFCCDAACDAPCAACAKALTGKEDGTCALASAGLDPHGDCKDDGAPLCDRNGLCDGKGACASYASKACTPSSCAADADCSSGHCADGVCCDVACDGECEACTKAKNGAADGTCAPVVADTDPDSECGPMGTGTCRGDARCDGAGACRVPAAGTECKAAACQDAVTLAAVSLCSPAGECVAETTACDPYTCDPTAIACRTSCARAADCAEGATCTDGACVRKPDGAPCSADNECDSLSCADGVCCEDACDGQCEACDGDGTAGQCLPVTGAPRGDREPCAGEGTCAGECNGALRDLCLYPGRDVTCGASSCADGEETRDQCNGLGVCVLAVATACAPFSCGDTACNTSCTEASDCGDGLTCAEGRCVSASSPSCLDGGGSGACAPPASDDGGCSCRVGGQASERSAASVALGLLCLGLFARRTYRVRPGAR